MTTRRIARMLIIAVLIAVSTPPRPAFAFDTWWHAEATRHGVVANGFSADARLAAQVTNYLTDFYTVTSHGIGGFEGLVRRLPDGRSSSSRSLEPVSTWCRTSTRTRTG